MPLGNSTRSVPSRGFILALIAITLAAAGLRFYKLTDSSFWNDELYTVRSALDMSNGNISKALGYMPARLALELDGVDRSTVDNTKPETWKAAGIDKFSLRLPHAILGLLTIPLLMLVARRPLGEPAAILFGLLLAASAWHIYWSQSARFYILQFLFFNLALLLWIPATRLLKHENQEGKGGSTRLFALAMLCAFGAFWSQPVSLMLYGILGLDWLISLIVKRPLAMTPARYAIFLSSASLSLGMLLWDLSQRSDEWSQFIGHATWLRPDQLVLAIGFFVWPATAVLVAIGSLWLMQTRSRLAVPLLLAAVVPTLIFAAISLNKGFVGSRYAFVSLGPILAIASLVLVEMFNLLRERGGVVLAAAPALTILTGQLFATVIYFRSGGAYHLPMEQTAEYLAGHRIPSETIYAHEDEILKYLLEDSNVAFEPRSPEDWAAITEPCWFVVGTGHSGKAPLHNRPGMILAETFRLYQVHSRAEVRVYKYNPRLSHQPPQPKSLPFVSELSHPAEQIGKNLASLPSN